MGANGHTPLTRPTAAALRQALGWVPPREATGAGGLTVSDGPNPVVTLDTAGGVTPGTFGDATHVARIQVDAQGRAEAVSSVAITYPADHGITQLTGDVTAGPGDGSQAATLATSGVTANTYGDSAHVPQVTFDAKGRATGASNVAIAFPAPAVPSVTFGVGAPAGTPANGALYFDTTLAAYVGYVGNGGVWNQF